MLGEVGQTYTPAGRHRGGDGPAHRRDPRARQLAARGRERPRRRARLRPRRTARSRSTTSRARPSRRSRSPARSRSSLITPGHACSTCRPRSRWPTARSARRTRSGNGPLTVRADPGPSSNVGTRDDRAEAGRRRASTAGCAASASASRPASTCPASSAASCSTQALLGLVDREHADRPGPAVTPIQMAAAYTAIANGGVMHRPYIVAGRPQARQARALAQHRGRGLADARGRAGRGRNGARRPPCPATRSRARPARPRSPRTGRYSKTDFVASFIGYAPARNPRLLVSVMVDEPRGDIYGGTVAAPAFERIMEFALPYLKIPPR